VPYSGAAKAAGAVTLHADLYWSFRSPYSYLAIGRYRGMTEEYDLEIALRPVYPLAVRQPDFFEKNHPNWLGYAVRDVARLSQYLDIPIAPPRPDPIVQDIATRRIAADQPYIFRLVRLGQAAARRGRGLAFCAEAARLIWGGTENWHEGDHLALAAERAGLELAELDREAEVDAEALDAEVAANQAALEAAGHWGVPTLVFMGEPFFGQDRIELALWRMKQAGLTAR
jgi:2-hydroxychromene-2-carboxylate isomerase